MGPFVMRVLLGQTPYLSDNMIQILPHLLHMNDTETEPGDNDDDNSVIQGVV